MTSSLRGALSLHNGSSGETADQLCLPDRSCRCVFHSVSLARSRAQLNRLTAGSKSFPAMSFVHADRPRKGHNPHCRRLPSGLADWPVKIGSASCRASVWTYVYISVVAVLLKQKKYN